MSKIEYKECVIPDAEWDVIEYQGQEHQLRYYEFEDEEGLVAGYAALEEFSDILRDKYGDPVSEEAGGVHDEIGVYVPRDIFYAGEATFINYVRDEFYS